MKSPSFTATLAPRTAQIVGGFAGGPGIDPRGLAEAVFKGEISGPWLTCYMLRRFGWPNSGSDDHKELFTWILTTSVPGLFVSVTPSLVGSNLHFAVRFDKAISSALSRDPGREAFSARNRAAVDKWWHRSGRKLYAIGTGKAVGDVDELVHKYAERDGKVSGLWRRKRANARMTALPKFNQIYRWLGDFIDKNHPEVRMPKMNKREEESRTTKFQLKLHAAFRATLRDLLRPTSVRDISFSPFGDVERTPNAIARSAKLKPTGHFEGAGYAPEEWFKRTARPRLRR